MLARRSTGWIVLALVALVALAGCAQPQDAGETGGPGDGPDEIPDEPAREPCAWANATPACRELPMDASGLSWVASQDAVLGGAAPGYTDPSTEAWAGLLDAGTLESRWAVDVRDAATEPPVLPSASGTRFFQLDGRSAIVRGTHGVEQATHRFEPLAWTGWSSPFTDLLVVETIPQSVGLDLHGFDLERGRSGTVSLGEKWTMEDGPDSAYFHPNGTRATFAVSTYGGSASVEDHDCFWLEIDTSNWTRSLSERSCELEPEGTLGPDRLLATRGDDVLLLDANLTPIASRTIPDLAGLTRFAGGSAIVAGRLDIGADEGSSLPSVLLDEDLERVRTVPGGTVQGFSASPYHAPCVAASQGAPNDGRTVRFLRADGGLVHELEIEPGVQGRVQAVCGPDGDRAAVALGNDLAIVPLDGPDADEPTNATEEGGSQ